MWTPAGKFRHRVQIQRTVPITNAFNEPIDNWQTLTTRWALIEPLSGRELWSAKQVQPDVTHRIRIRYTPGLRSTMRLVYQGRIFNLLSILNLEERNIELEMMAQEQA